MLAAGTTQGASVWHYLAPAMAWHTLCALPLPSPQAPVAALHWAPNLSGSSRERLAAAQGRTVAIVSLTAAPPAAPSAAGEGEGSGPLRGELLAELPHGAEVWRVEWDLLGSCLAAGTEDGRVCLWKADLAGGWAPYGQLVGEDVEAATAMAAD